MCDKMVVMMNHDDEISVMAALVMGGAIAATGSQPLIFVQPGAAKTMVKGALEQYQGLKGQPDPVFLFESINVLEGRFILCELGLPISDITKEDLYDEVEVMNATSFLWEVEDAKLVFSY